MSFSWLVLSVSVTCLEFLRRSEVIRTSTFFITPAWSPGWKLCTQIIINALSSARESLKISGRSHTLANDLSGVRCQYVVVRWRWPHRSTCGRTACWKRQPLSLLKELSPRPCCRWFYRGPAIRSKTKSFLSSIFFVVVPVSGWHNSCNICISRIWRVAILY